jgi:hypothetical protein
MMLKMRDAAVCGLFKEISKQELLDLIDEAYSNIQFGDYDALDHLLDEVFCWECMPQGGEFWSEIHDKAVDGVAVLTKEELLSELNKGILIYDEESFIVNWE